MKKSVFLVLTLLFVFLSALALADENVMTHAQFMQAGLDDPVCVETYVQATESWWDNKIVVYAQSKDGAYYIYNMACSESDAAKLTSGKKIRVSGYKGEWAGNIEISGIQKILYIWMQFIKTKDFFNF